MNKNIHLETDRLILREWEDRDLEPFARLNADPLVMQYLPRVLDKKATKRHMKEFQKDFKKHGYGLYVIEEKETSEFVGFTGLHNVDFEASFTPAVGLAWRIDYEYWGKGFGSEAARAVIDHAFNNLKLKELVAFTVYDNSRTIHLMEKMGFKYQKGKDFDYPALRVGHPLGRFVLYKLKP
ncbi:MAG: GNAT family N-acetyltransferase [Micavibrio sp.]|nr:GNAT family N-acetyltransferase [Micavibrio sp.]